MIESAPNPLPNDDRDGWIRNELPPQDETTPRWVKLFGAVALGVILIVVIVHLAGGGFHGHGIR